MAKSDEFLSQARRLGGLHFTPQTPEAWGELAKILMRKCRDVEHASRVIDRFLEPGAREECPTPGDLAVMALRVPADAKLDRPDLADPCDECRPCGGTHRRAANGGLERCGCPRGLKLTAMDEARNQPAPARQTKAAHEHPADADWMRRAAGDVE